MVAIVEFLKSAIQMGFRLGIDSFPGEISALVDGCNKSRNKITDKKEERRSFRVLQKRLQAITYFE